MSRKSKGPPGTGDPKFEVSMSDSNGIPLPYRKQLYQARYIKNINILYSKSRSKVWKLLILLGLEKQAI